MHLSNSPASRKELVQRLNAKLKFKVDTTGTDWLTIGELRPLTFRRVRGIKAPHPAALTCRLGGVSPVRWSGPAADRAAHLEHPA